MDSFTVSGAAQWAGAASVGPSHGRATVSIEIPAARHWISRTPRRPVFSSQVFAVPVRRCCDAPRSCRTSASKTRSDSWACTQTGSPNVDARNIRGRTPRSLISPARCLVCREASEHGAGIDSRACAAASEQHALVACACHGSATCSSFAVLWSADPSECSANCDLHFVRRSVLTRSPDLDFAARPSRFMCPSLMACTRASTSARTSSSKTCRIESP